ncbi:hypothetical protein LCGC14_1601030 [marine sediment metagenome]|uniref:Uncharacterized protein n=1 Tax=marine sediment metagenome TaxID=412755 RepID=A0A0F9IBJ5_9ZZZZ
MKFFVVMVCACIGVAIGEATTGGSGEGFNYGQLIGGILGFVIGGGVSLHLFGPST